MDIILKGFDCIEVKLNEMISVQKLVLVVKESVKHHFMEYPK